MGVCYGAHGGLPWGIGLTVAGWWSTRELPAITMLEAVSIEASYRGRHLPRISRSGDAVVLGPAGIEASQFRSRRRRGYDQVAVRRPGRNRCATARTGGTLARLGDNSVSGVVGVVGAVVVVGCRVVAVCKRVHGEMRT